MKTGAFFSEDRKYRYLLTREWGKEPKLGLIALNPSTADETKDDPTIRRCIGFAKSWGYGGLLMGNIFAYRSTDPKGLLTIGDPIGPENDGWLDYIKRKSGLTVAAWGVHGHLMGRGEVVRRNLRRLYVLGLTKEGFPKHPLYLPKTLEPVRWRPNENPSQEAASRSRRS